MLFKYDEEIETIKDLAEYIKKEEEEAKRAAAEEDRKEKEKETKNHKGSGR